MLLVHASPGRDDGPGLDPHTRDADLEPVFAASDAPLVLVGHTHHPDDRRLGSVRVVNPGSVSLPRASDALTRYAILTSTSGDWSVEHRVVPYDRASVLADLAAGDHPSADWLIGKLTTPWAGRAPPSLVSTSGQGRANRRVTIWKGRSERVCPSQEPLSNGRSSRSTSVTEPCSNVAPTRTRVRAPSGS